MNEAEIDAIVARVQAGDREAFAELVFEVRRELRIFLSAHATSIDMVEEVLQATLVECYENIRRYELRSTFLPWIKGIGRNLLRREIAARARCVATEGDQLERILLETALADDDADADRQQELVERLHACLEKLPEAWRKMIERRYFDRLSIRELARSMDRTETWAAVNLFRIRDALRACMAGEGDA